MIHRWLCRMGIHLWANGAKWTATESTPFRYCKCCGVVS